MTEAILVTAVGGDLGQALVKALSLEGGRYTVHGCDTDGAGIGSAFVDGFHVVPPATHPDYLDTITGIAARIGARAVIPANEAEIRVLSSTSPSPALAGGIPVVCQPGQWVEVHGDKLTSMRSLAGHVTLAGFADGTDPLAVERLIGEAGFPLVVKARRSSGSRFRHVVRDVDALRRALDETPMPLVQAYLDDQYGEYSVGVFSCDSYRTAIAFRRELGVVGCSWYAETSSDADVLQYAMDVAAASNLVGSANVQVRKTSKGVRLLEINPRFSSLVAARAACGFRDAAWALSLAMGNTPDPPPAEYRPVRFRRFFHELVDFGSGYNAVAEWMPRRQAAP